MTTRLERSSGGWLSIRSVLAAALVAAFPAAVGAEVTPPEVNAVLAPGASTDVAKSVDVPEVPPVLDLCLVVDLSGSYGDDIANIKALDDGIFDAVRAEVADSLFCAASFVDYPFSGWGNAGDGDYAYRLDQDLTAGKAAWTGAISAMGVRNGGDIPESQYEALLQLATGAGRDVPPAGPSLGDLTGGQGASFRAGATKVVAITTDAPFHVAGDGGGPFPYPGPTRDDTVNALNAAGIKVVAIKAPGSGAQMDDLASATGGSVQTTGASSAEIATAILEGISSLPQDISAVPVGCDPLVVTFDPSVIPGVVGPAVANFTETIAVPGDAPQGASIDCEVQFKADDTVIGTQHLSIEIPDVTAPEVACQETVNPHGDKVPPAGSTTLPGPKGGQNPDGFYQLLATDNLDPAPQIFVTDSGGAGPFGPFASGDNVKITEAPGADPGSKSIGSSSGSAGAVVAHITLNGDAIVTAVDASGNSESTTCLVPPPPL
jgi:hypothetical protein